MGWLSNKRDEKPEAAVAPPQPELKSRPRSLPSGWGDRLPVSPQDILSMQRLVGNRAVGQMLESDPHTMSEGQKLDDGVRRKLEPKFQHSLGDVRVHTGSEAAKAAKTFGAQAFTLDKHIFFAGGKFQPDSPSGMQLLSHELAHVAQQRSSSGATSVADSTLESEAEHAESGVPGTSPTHFSSAGGARVQGKAEAGKEEGFFHRVGGAIWSGLKAVGRGIATAAGAVWSGIKWLGTQIWDKVTGALGRITHWITRLPERVGRLVMGLIHGISSVRPWSLAWWESLGHLSTWEHFLSWIGNRLIDLLEIAGVGEVAETINDFVKFNTRALSSREAAIAHSVFGKSIDLHLVRIDERAVLGPAFSKRAFTSFHTINGWGGLEDSVLVHELTHVWQYEKSGAVYMAQALHAQIKRGLGAYDYGGPDGLRAARSRGKGITSFNREEQAQIVQDFYLIKHGQLPWVGSGTVADLPLYAHFVKTVSTLPESQLLV
jgi:hypothetical protein